MVSGKGGRESEFLGSGIVTKNLACTALLPLPKILIRFLSSISQNESFWKIMTGSCSLLHQDIMGANRRLSINIFWMNEIQSILKVRYLCAFTYEEAVQEKSSNQSIRWLSRFHLQFWNQNSQTLQSNLWHVLLLDCFCKLRCLFGVWPMHVRHFSLWIVIQEVPRWPPVLRGELHSAIFITHHWAPGPWTSCLLCYVLFCLPFMPQWIN